MTTGILCGTDSQAGAIAPGQVLLESRLFEENREYVRTQIIHSLLQEDEAQPLSAITCLLLLDGQRDESVFSRMIDEACFPRMLELINEGANDDPRLRRFLLQLMYEMSRMERLRRDDILLVDDNFIHYLFDRIEHVSEDMNDPYHYPTIRVLVRTTPSPSPLRHRPISEER